MGHFRFEITDLDGAEIGEVQNASVRWIEPQLKKPATAGFTVRTTNDLLEELYEADRRLLVHRDSDLMFHGPVTSLEAAAGDAQGPTVAATASDPAFYFTKRVSGRAASGALFNGVDKLSITKQLIDAANVDGETGVRAVAMTSGTTAVYVAGPYKLLDECIVELADTFDGFDWKINPIEYDAGKIGEFEGAAVIGSTRLDAVFEYGPGTRANVKEFNYQRAWTDLANFVYSIPQDLQTGAVLTATDAPSQAARGLYAATIDSGEVTNATLRGEVNDFHLQIRKDPRNVLTFTPVVDPDEGASVPLYGRDYEIGDLVPVQISPEGVPLVNGHVRIYKVRIEIDKDGRASYTPVTVPE